MQVDRYPESEVGNEGPETLCQVHEGSSEQMTKEQPSLLVFSFFFLVSASFASFALILVSVCLRLLSHILLLFFLSDFTRSLGAHRHMKMEFVHSLEEQEKIHITAVLTRQMEQQIREIKTRHEQTLALEVGMQTQKDLSSTIGEEKEEEADRKRCRTKNQAMTYSWTHDVHHRRHHQIFTGTHNPLIPMFLLSCSVRALLSCLCDFFLSAFFSFSFSFSSSSFRLFDYMPSMECCNGIWMHFIAMNWPLSLKLLKEQRNALGPKFNRDL